MYTNANCCPPGLCNEECVIEKEDCDPVDPPTECVWGYRLGDSVAEILLKLVEKRIVDETGLT